MSSYYRSTQITQQYETLYPYEKEHKKEKRKKEDINQIYISIYIYTYVC